MPVHGSSLSLPLKWFIVYVWSFFYVVVISLSVVVLCQCGCSLHVCGMARSLSEWRT